MSDQTVTAYTIKNFKDAGTEQRFEADKVLPIDAGAFGNYAAAGLARLATEDEIKAAAAAAAPSADTKVETPSNDGKPKSSPKAP